MELQDNLKTNNSVMPVEIEESLQRCADPAEAWSSFQARKYLTEVTTNWLVGLCDWKVFLTLTFREEKAPDVAKAYWNRLVRELNKELVGKRYSKIVKHSYFSYVLGVEYQKRDVIHFHAIVDKPLNFKRIHTLWNEWAGFAWTEIIKDRQSCVQYVAKYTLKGGNLDIFQSKKNYIPNPIPSWWKLSKETQLLLLGESSN